MQKSYNQSHNQPQIKILNNGFKIIYFHIPDLKSISLNLRVKAGSLYESENQIGAAHFTEHLILTGTTKYPTPERLKALILDVGGELISSTSREDVIYFIKLIKSDLYNGLEFFSQILQHATFNETQFVKHKDIIKHEIKRTLNNPERAIFRINHKILFPKHRLGNLSTGHEKNIDKLTINTLKHFYKEMYQPQNCTLCVCGDLTSITDVESYFENMLEGNTKEYKEVETDTEFRVQQLVLSHLKQSHIEVSFYGFPRFSKEDYILKYISKILAGNNIGVLQNKIRTDKGFAYSVLAETFSGKDFGIFGIYTACEEKNIQDVLDLIKAGINEISTSLTDQQLFNKIKRSLINEIIFAFEKPDVISNFYSAIGLYENLTYTHYKEIEQLESITKEDVFEFAKVYFKQKPKITLIAPKVIKDITWSF